MKQYENLKIVFVSGVTAGVEWAKTILESNYKISAFFTYDEIIKIKPYPEINNCII